MPHTGHQPVASGSGTRSAYADYPGSDWSTASRAIKRPHTDTPATPSTRGTRGSQAQQLTTYDSSAPKVYSRLKQEVLPESEYLTGLEDVILRDFFPQLATITAQQNYAAAVERGDDADVEASVRRMRELYEPTSKRRTRDQTPGRTPYAADRGVTPSYRGATPSSARSSTSRVTAQSAPGTRYDGSLSLDEFQRRYTSEDNSSFGDILAKDNQARREKNAWAFEAEERANQKMIRGREARERLVDVTRKMVEASKDGTVLMIDGPAGKPGERKLIAEGGVLGAEGASRLLVEGSRSAEGRLLITAPDTTQRDEVRDRQLALATLDRDRRGKGKKESEQQYVDYDKPTAEEEEENLQPAEAELQAPMEGWPYKVRNALYFGPDANGDSHADAAKERRESKAEAAAKGEPKQINHAATRLDRPDDDGRRSRNAPASPTRSRIHAAISGTPYPGAGSRSSSPRVGGFGFVDELPTPRAGAGGSVDKKGLEGLMTWGTIAQTPIRSGSTAAAALKRSALGEGGGPFGIAPTPRREQLAHQLATKARKNMGTSSRSLRKSALHGSIRSGATPRERVSPAGSSVGESSPRAGALSPAAQSLLKRTGQGKALGSGMASSAGWGESEREREREERLRRKTRELESRERIRRERWDASPALSEVDVTGERSMKGVHQRRED